MGDWLTLILEDADLLTRILNIIFVLLMSVYFLSDDLAHLLLLIPRGQEGNSDPVIGRAIKL